MRIGLNAGHTLSGAGSGTSGAIVESIETRRVCNRLTEMFIIRCGCCALHGR